MCNLIHESNLMRESVGVCVGLSLFFFYGINFACACVCGGQLFFHELNLMDM